MNAVDLFAGPGGWDLGARAVGLDPLGIEWDDAACMTREAAGLRTVQADVAALDPLDYSPCDLLIASPPCQAWSMAGKRGGERDKEHVIACLMELAAGSDTRTEHAAKCEDARSMLVVEPLRWALALRPRLLAFEQVPPVLGLWTLIAGLLEPHGWKCWAGVLEAERYGVPQTRERAILMGSRDGMPHPPRATHQRYVPGEPQRHDVTLEGETLPWVSMADALGWGATERPTPTLAVGKTGDGRVWGSDGHGSAAGLLRERDRGAWLPVFKKHYGEGMIERHGDREPVSASEPAPVITSKARSATWEDPLGLKSPDWYERHPATTVAGDARIFQPGNHREDVPGEQSQNAVRVTVQQAAILQTFPPDYPWQGSRTKQFEQVGNAVPPMLAAAVLAALIGRAA